MKTTKLKSKKDDLIIAQQNQLENTKIGANIEDFIFLKIKRGVKKKIFLKDIIYCKADNVYTIFYLMNKEEYIISYPIGKIEKLLIKYDFIRISKSYIVNPIHIDKINCLKKSSIELINNTKLDVSKPKIKEIECFLSKKYKCFTSL